MLLWQSYSLPIFNRYDRYVVHIDSQSDIGIIKACYSHPLSFIVRQVGMKKVRPSFEIHHPYVPKFSGIRGSDELKIVH